MVCSTELTLTTQLTNSVNVGTILVEDKLENSMHHLKQFNL